jgi:hypothetical protein
MRTATFEVPTEVIGEFAQKLVESTLNNSVTATTEDNDIVIEVYYEKHETKEVDGLEEHLADLIETMEEDEEEE